MKKSASLLIITAALTACMSKEEVVVRVLAKAHTGDAKTANFNVIRTNPQALFDDFYHAENSNGKKIKKYQKNATVTHVNGVVNSVGQKDIFLKVENKKRSDCGVRADTSKIETRFTVGDNVNLWIVIKPDSKDLNEVKNTCILTITPTVGRIKKE